MTNYWWMTPFPNDETAFGNAWNYDLVNGTIAVGWPELGDATGLNSDEIKALYDKVNSKKGKGHGSNNDRFAAINFLNNLKAGDKIIAKTGKSVMLAIGTVVERPRPERKKEKTVYYSERMGRDRVIFGDKVYSNFVDVEWEMKRYKLPPETFKIGTIGSLTHEDFDGLSALNDAESEFHSFIQRIANDSEMMNYQETIAKSIINFNDLNDNEIRWINTMSNCDIRSWELTDTDNNRSTWSKMVPGDLVLFQSNNELMSAGTVLFIYFIQKNDLNVKGDVQSTDANKKQYGLVYFLHNYRDLHIPNKEILNMARLPTFSNKRTLALIDDSKVDKKKILLPMNKTSHENFIKINQYNDPIEAEAEAEIRIKLLRTSPEERKKIIVAQLKNAKAPPNLGSYMSITERKKRDYKTVNWLKHLYDYQCQICGLVLPTKSGGFWIEAAHIKAKRDAGKETPDNLLI
jgi:hypothetical protein